MLLLKLVLRYFILFAFVLCVHLVIEYCLILFGHSQQWYCSCLSLMLWIMLPYSSINSAASRLFIFLFNFCTTKSCVLVASTLLSWSCSSQTLTFNKLTIWGFQESEVIWKITCSIDLARECLNISVLESRSAWE